MVPITLGVHAVASVMSTYLWPHGRQPSSLLCPRDSPGIEVVLSPFHTVSSVVSIQTASNPATCGSLNHPPLLQDPTATSHRPGNYDETQGSLAGVFHSLYQSALHSHTFFFSSVPMCPVATLIPYSRQTWHCKTS